MEAADDTLIWEHARATSAVTRIKSGFRLRSIVTRTTLPDWSLPHHSGVSQSLTSAQYGPNVGTEFPLGRYLEDFEWAAGVGDLDQYNGRFAVTPEFPGGTYAQMDFATRDRYRHVAEQIARAGKLAEPDVAQAALQLASDHAATAGIQALGAHVGYYLIDEGRAALERALSLRRGMIGALRGAAQR